MRFVLLSSNSVRSKQARSTRNRIASGSVGVINLRHDRISRANLIAHRSGHCWRRGTLPPTSVTTTLCLLTSKSRIVVDSLVCRQHWTQESGALQILSEELGEVATLPGLNP